METVFVFASSVEAWGFSPTNKVSTKTGFSPGFFSITLNRCLWLRRKSEPSLQLPSPPIAVASSKPNATPNSSYEYSTTTAKKTASNSTPTSSCPTTSTCSSRPPKKSRLKRPCNTSREGFSFQLKSPFDVWERSFKEHRIKDKQDYTHHLRYIEQNPVRANLSPTAEQFPYSSASSQQQIDPLPLHFTL